VLRPNFPYEAFRNTEAWISVEDIVQQLVENTDLELTTAPEYVVGAICKRLADDGLLTAKAKMPASSQGDTPSSQTVSKIPGKRKK